MLFFFSFFFSGGGGGEWASLLISVTNQVVKKEKNHLPSEVLEHFCEFAQLLRSDFVHDPNTASLRRVQLLGQGICL